MCKSVSIFSVYQPYEMVLSAEYRYQQRKADGTQKSADDGTDVMADGLGSLKAGKMFVQVIDDTEHQTGNCDTASEAAQGKGETTHQTAGHGSTVIVTDGGQGLT